MSIERHICFIQMAKFGLRARGVVHVGANDGEECPWYAMEGIKKVLFIEPSNVAFDLLQEKLKKYPQYDSVQALCADTDGAEITLNVANNQGQSSSILNLGRHSDVYPHITYVEKQVMSATRLDTLIETSYSVSDYNVLIMDIQGAELTALRGSERIIKQFDVLFLECSATSLYEGGCTIQELVNFLAFYDFGLRWMDLDTDDSGNCLFVANRTRGINASKPDIITSGTNVALGKPIRTSSQASYAGPLDPNAVVSGRRTNTYAFHTEHEEKPWIEVDLGADLKLSELIVFNRIDAAPERAKHMEVFIKRLDEDWEKVHNQGGLIFGGADGNPLRIQLDNRIARLVRLQLPGSGCFHLAEIEIYTEGQ